MNRVVGHLRGKVQARAGGRQNYPPRPRSNCATGGDRYHGRVAAVLNVLISHQPAAALRRVLRFWEGAIAERSLLLAYGGTRENFAALEFTPRLFIDDPRLRTRDHQREAQSLTGLFRTVRD